MQPHVWSSGLGAGQLAALAPRRCTRGDEVARGAVLVQVRNAPPACRTARRPPRGHADAHAHLRILPRFSAHAWIRSGSVSVGTGSPVRQPRRHVRRVVFPADPCPRQRLSSVRLVRSHKPTPSRPPPCYDAWSAGTHAHVQQEKSL